VNELDYVVSFESGRFFDLKSLGQTEIKSNFALRQRLPCLGQASADSVAIHYDITSMFLERMEVLDYQKLDVKLNPLGFFPTPK